MGWNVALLVIGLIGSADLECGRRIGDLKVRIIDGTMFGGMLGWFRKVLMVAHIGNLLLIYGIGVRSWQILMWIAGHWSRSVGYSIAGSRRMSRSWRWLIVRSKRVIWLEALLHRRQPVLLVRNMLMCGD